MCRSRLAHAIAALMVIPLGLAWRHPALGLPWPVAKYGGSALWGAMILLWVSAALPTRPAAQRALVALAVTILVELSRLHHAPWIDGFRETRAGALLLGRIFSVWNMVAYAAGIGACFLAARALDRVTGPALGRVSATSPSGRGTP